MKKGIGWIVALIVIALIGFAVYQKTQKSEPASSNEAATPTASASTSGSSSGGASSTTGSSAPEAGKKTAATGGSTTGASGGAVSSTTVEEPAASGIVWNTTDPDAYANGNLSLAAKYLRQNGKADGHIRPDAAPVLKSPSSYYGQTLCFSGTVAAVDASPDDKVLKTLGTEQATEVVLQHADHTTLDFLIIGTPGDLKLGTSFALCGMPTGTTQAENGPDQIGPRLILVGKMN